MTLSRRRFLTGAAALSATLLLPTPEIALATPDEVRRFWPGWRAPRRGGPGAIIRASPPARPLTPEAIESELERLWNETARPDPGDLVFVMTRPAEALGEIGLWTGVAFVPFIPDARITERDGSVTPFPGDLAVGGIQILGPEQLHAWAHGGGPYEQ